MHAQSLTRLTGIFLKQNWLLSHLMSPYFLVTMEKFNSLSLSDRKLVIGIDFGTTFTGVAWAETRRVSLFTHYCE